MSRREKREEKQGSKIFLKIIIVAIFLASVVFSVKYAQNFLRDDLEGKTNLIINNNNVTADLRKDVIVENGMVYISKEDIENFFDPYIYYDETYNRIITTSNNKVAYIVVGENKMKNNGSNVNISGTVINRDGTYYIPFSEMQDIYEVEAKYISNKDCYVIESLNRKKVVADSNKDNSVKYKRTIFSKNVDKIKKGENVVVVNNSSKDGWVMVRTQNGKLGYVKEDTLTNNLTLRDNLVTSKKIEGNISLIWDYFSEYGEAPYREGSLKGVNVVSPTFFTLEKLGKGNVNENVGTAGKQYIEWAHNQGYKVWPSISNNSYIDTTSEIMRDSKLREDLIERIVSYIVKYNLDGINIDFEYMYSEDKNLFSRFLIELKPRLNEIGAVLSVDFTAPDGGENWSMCYDRHTIGKIADYVVFMAYDQNTTVGTNAGYDWTEVSLKKLVGTQEEIESSKIILAIPFYTRVWYETSDGWDNEAIDMKSLDSIIPSSATKTWDDSLKQYEVSYTKNGRNYKTWIEDEKSIEAKLSLIEQYKLAGAGYWKKGSETESIWNLISEKLGIK